MTPIPVRRDKLGQLICPACEQSHFNLGPTALGNAVNIECCSCGARWNWMIPFNQLQAINTQASQSIQSADTPTH